MVYFRVVKSVSLAFPGATGVGSVAAAEERSQVHELRGRAPQAHAAAASATAAFSRAALSHVHCPAGRARHEHRGPTTAFSAAALSHVQCSADCLPQEQVACEAAGERGLVSERVLFYFFLLVVLLCLQGKKLQGR